MRKRMKSDMEYLGEYVEKYFPEIKNSVGFKIYLLEKHCEVKMKKFENLEIFSHSGQQEIINYGIETFAKAITSRLKELGMDDRAIEIIKSECEIRGIEI